MHFALLVSQLPHLADARGHYPNPLAQATRTDRARQAASRCLAGLARLAARRKLVG
ncbi:hypothetical protein [Trinickia dinghuensis]|uniref:hypothetical protein n=1 Tax=Trinickia dinghuensis TaxID=2291023 RepID=UPI0015F1A05D|nr:hypothetical protein [Trinickia dinghuensis]